MDNPKEYFLAIDLGASSGRHILGSLDNGILVMDIVHSFKNEMIHKNGNLCWDIDYLFEQILQGLENCRNLGKTPRSVAIDTWGVDFVLLDANDEILGDTVAYRDERTRGIAEKSFAAISSGAQYEKTGIIPHEFNTLYQLIALKEKHPEYLSQAKTFLLLPEYINFLLTGVKKSEYTNSSTTGMLNANTKDWDKDILAGFGLPEHIFSTPAMPPISLGSLRPEIAERIGFNTEIILTASHDTASAVVATPFDANSDDALFLSSGTWSLLGVEISSPMTDETAKKMGLSNEGGYGGNIRLLKNIMGLWMIQSVVKELGGSGEKYSYAELDKMAESSDIDAVIDPEDDAFFAPASMISAIRDACKKSGQTVPQSPGELAKVIYKSLAVCYNNSINEFEKLFKKNFNTLHIIGGGSRANYLNSLTAEITGKKIICGPVEATALGNIAVQMMFWGVFGSLAEARSCISVFAHDDNV